ncbi:MAG: hypothetical protein ACOX61_11250 [Brooklawnia sp.]
MGAASDSPSSPVSGGSVLVSPLSPTIPSPGQRVSVVTCGNPARSSVRVISRHPCSWLAWMLPSRV